jgi:hypothetical protein
MENRVSILWTDSHFHFFKGTTIPAMMPTQFSVEWAQGCFPWDYRGRDVSLVTHHNIVPKCVLSRTISQFLHTSSRPDVLWISDMCWNTVLPASDIQHTALHCTDAHNLHIKGKAVPLQAWSGPEGSRKLSFPDFMTTAQDGAKVVSLTHRPLYPQEIHLVLISVRGWVDLRAIVLPEGSCHWKIPMTPSGNEPAICRFVANALTTTPPHPHYLHMLVHN